MTEVEPPEPPGVSVPLLGDIRLPRTREEREGADRAPPVAVRDGNGESRTAFRRLATRVAARVNRVAADSETDAGAVAHSPAAPEPATDGTDAEAGVGGDPGDAVEE